LAQRFDVIVPDHPGFGGAEAPAWIDDISDLAYGYLDAIEVLGLPGVHIVGQSLGGWIALEMAVRSTRLAGSDKKARATRPPRWHSICQPGCQNDQS
jgi:pimeloyl-ACP methyl ester carboxylesterase